MANSNVIIAQLGHAASAAKVCRDYTGGGKTDWFLPSKDELAELYAQEAVVGGFNGNSFWSSSEYANSHAWVHFFASNLQSWTGKGVVLFVRTCPGFLILNIYA